MSIRIGYGISDGSTTSSGGGGGSTDPTISARQVILWSRSLTRPANPPSSVSFDGTAWTGLGGTSWTTDIPTGNQQIWQAIGIATIQSDGSYVLSGWEVVPVAQRTSSNRTLLLFQRKTGTAPAAPTFTYRAETDDYSAALGSWSRSVPSGTNALYMAVASYTHNSSTDVWSTSAWRVVPLTGTSTWHAAQFAETVTGPWSTTVPTTDPYWVRYRLSGGTWSDPLRVGEAAADILEWQHLSSLSTSGTGYSNKTITPSLNLDHYQDLMFNVKIWNSWSNLTIRNEGWAIIPASELVVTDNGTSANSATNAHNLVLRQYAGLNIMGWHEISDANDRQIILNVQFQRASGTTTGRIVNRFRIGGAGHNRPYNVGFWAR